MRIFYILLVFIILLSLEQNCCLRPALQDMDLTLIVAKQMHPLVELNITLTNVSESTRKCSWPADTKFEFTIKKFGLIPLGGTEAI